MGVSAKMLSWLVRSVTKGATLHDKSKYELVLAVQLRYMGANKAERDGFWTSSWLPLATIASMPSGC